MRNENPKSLCAMGEFSPSGPAPAIALMPPDVVFSQRAAALLRAYLSDHDLGHFRIFHAGGDDVHEIELLLKQLGEPTAAWEASPALVSGGDAIAHFTSDENSARLRDGGFLRLTKYEAVAARWYWIDRDGELRAMYLCAARSPADFFRLRQQIASLRRGRGKSVWQILRGHARWDRPSVPRIARNELLLSEQLQRRIDVDLIRFFSDDVRQLYAAMNVPYRRGVLLHGPPGNGKTSLIRQLGVGLPDIPAMLLRPQADFDGDDLEEVLRRWSAQAPAILVIEDLNWLLKQVNVSMFLNALDGVDTAMGRGLLLIATTNHPHELDPAINNRPGRFDVVIEVPPPDLALRLEFLRRHLPQIVPGALETVAAETDRLSFAHLQEIVRLSGLNAIHAGRNSRSDDDLLSAAATVREANEEALRGFPEKPQVPFGLQHLRKLRE